MRIVVPGSGTGFTSQGTMRTAPPAGVSYALPPLTIGFWFYVTVLVGSRVYFQLLNSASGAAIRFTSSNNYFGTDGTNVFSIAAGTENAGSWHFCLIREIATNNRWLSVFERATGATTHTNNTTAMAWVDSPDVFDVCNMGNATGTQLDCFINEFWYMTSDVQQSAGQVSDALFSQLLKYGPFSVPSIASSILEYRRWRIDPSMNGAPQETYVGPRLTAPVWTPTIITSGSGVPVFTGSPSPPLSGQYIRPRQTKTVLLM